MHDKILLVSRIKDFQLIRLLLFKLPRNECRMFCFHGRREYKVECNLNCHFFPKETKQRSIFQLRETMENIQNY